MLRVRSARERALLAILALLVLLGGVAALAAWRARSEWGQHHALEQRSAVAAALDDARAHILLNAINIAAATFAEDLTPLQDLHRETDAVVRQDLAQARADLTAMGETDDLSSLDRVVEQMDELVQESDLLVSFASMETGARVEVAQEYYPILWPKVETLIAGLDELAKRQQIKLAAEQAAANRASDTTLALLIASSAFAFLTGSGVLILVLLSVMRPLAALQSKVRSVALGNLEAQAKPSGPEEVASLARDFNEMMDRRRETEEALRDSDERYRTLFERSLDAVYVHDFQGRFIDANEAALKLLGYTREEVSKLSFTDLLDDSQLPTALAALDELLRTGRQAKPNTFSLKRKDGTFIEMEVVAAVVQREGQPSAIQGVGRDITDRRRAEDALRESEVQYRQIFETTQDIFYRTDAHGIITEISPSVKRWGYKREELIGTQVLDVYESPEERSGLLKALLEQGEVTDYEVRLKAADGHVVYSSVGSHIVRDASGAVVGVEGVLRDISERKRAEEALREQMRRDSLTGVLNHAAIVDELRGLISDGDGTPCAVVMSDVDDLKAINDTFGHQVGDHVLVAVARALCRDGVSVGRYGGDEFVAILPGADRDTAERYRKETLDALAKVAVRDSQSGAAVPVVVSMGLAAYPVEAGRIEELINLADSGMYGAKRQRPLGSASVRRTPLLADDRAAKMVGEIVPLLTSAGDLNDKLRLVAHRLSVAAGYDAVNFGLFKSEANVPATMNTFGQLPEKLVATWHWEQLRSGRDTHPIRQLVGQGRPIIFNDPQHDERLTTVERELLCAGELRSALVAPMIWRNELIGMLSVASKRESAFIPRDAQFLMAIATQVTAVVRMETLVDELQSASGRLAQAHTETVMLLAAAAEAHDRTTGKHLQNVRAISEGLARELGWGEEDASELGLAAVLHDIGKIRVADSVLANTGRLSEEEWELMKHHAVWGEEFLAGRPGFELASVIARSHHERWHGGGYPAGLSGEEIPEAAAIVAVADSFDAMTSDRPYRPRRSRAAAVQEIAACSGKQFSPRVVQALMRLHKRRMLPPSHRQAPSKKAA